MDAADVRDDDDDVLRCQKHVVSSVLSRKKKHLFFTADSPISAVLDALDISYCQTNFDERQLDTARDVMNAFPREEEEEEEEEEEKKETAKAAKRIDAIATELCFGEEKYARAIARELDDIRRRDDATSMMMMMMMDDDYAFEDTTKKKKNNRGMFGAAAAAAREEEEHDDDENQTHYRAKKKDGRTMTRGRVYSKTFLEKTKRLYDMHMGAENMGPVLYSFCRFTKPENVLEIGAGYTSVFLLQAMRDNKEEIATYERMRKENSCTVRGDNGENTPWSNEAYFSKSSRSRRGSNSSKEGTAYSPQLHVVDNMAHAYTTAHLVKECSQELNENTINVGDEKDVFLTVHEADAFHPDLSATLAPGVQFDFLWIDLGAANRIETFLQNFWFRVKPGGYVAVHSTLTNSLSREWLEKMRALARNGGKNEDGTMGEYGVFEIMSFMEPHKLFQNSFTIFQRRDQHPIDSKEYKEPVLTKYP